ncbi:unannotated protein [freshwater metagenome]|uniref:Unannotated protein n=1 Tax=freshwater metagenome TaxID=449393 RepID=A0A6J7IZ24_9ZZZZ|nr:TetR family transcriptional regulator [Actinomycetota bacterium]
MQLNKYAPQVHTHRRTQSAILAGTKNLIATVGLAKMSMIEIADTSEVSRATLYNHYRDKESVVLALCESECARLINIAHSAPDATDALELLSIQISTDSALAHMRTHDLASLTQALSAKEHRLWSDLTQMLAQITGSQVLADLSLRWLIGQVLNPLTPQDSRLHAELLLSRANI